MSVEGEGSNEQNPQQQQPQQQQHNLVHQDLNFSINDILSNNHDVNDDSFQSIVQTLSNNNNDQHITPSYAHLPAELQDLFSNETDDLLSTQGSNSDASILHGDMSHMWNQQQQQQPFMASPQQQQAVKPTPSPQQTPSNISTPSISTPTTIPQQQQHTPTPPPPQQQQQQQQPASSTTLLDNITSQLPPEKKDRFIQLFRELQTSSVSATDFLSQAKSLLGQQQYQQLEDLKNKPAQLAQKPIAAAASPANIRPADDDNRKRTLTSSQIRAEDAQRSMPGMISSTPQLKRAKTEHIPMPSPQQSMLQHFHQPPQTLQQQQQLQQHLQMQLHQQHLIMQQQQQQQQHLQQQQQQQQQLQPNNNTNNQIPVPSQLQQQPVTPQLPSQQQTQTPPINITQSTQPNTPPVFKTPAVPGTPGLQIPTRNNTPQASSSKPAASNAAPAAGGGGDSRIDYEALTDVMGYAGVDLKEEAEHFMKDGDGPGGILPDGIDRSKMQDFMNTEMLRDRILKYAKCVDIKEIDGDFVSYLALAAQDRIRTVMGSMVSASKHRTHNPIGKPPLSQEGHPLFKIQVKQNVKLQLEAIQRVSRQTELDLDPPMDEDDDDEEQEKSKEKGWFSKKSKRPLTQETSGVEKKRKITVQDAIFVMERDVQGGRGTNQKALLRAYNEWLS